MKYIYSILFFLVLASLLVTCDECEPGPDRSNEANVFLNENIILPPRSFQVSEEQITFRGGTSTTNPESMVVSGGEDVTVSTNLDASDDDITHIGIRFGDTGDPWIIPKEEAETDANGNLTFGMIFPRELCDQLSSICHDIRCYEFAVSASADGETFEFSRENINELASSCGNCDEPSCRGIVTCGGDGIVGTWRELHPACPLTWIFEADGTANGSDCNGSFAATYSINDTIITITDEVDGPIPFEFTIEGDILTLIDIEYGDILTFQRQ